MVNKGSHFADFVRFRPHTYTRSQQFMPPLWAAIIYFGHIPKFRQYLIWVLFVNSEGPTFKLLVNLLFHSVIVIVDRKLFLWRKIVQNPFIFVYLLCPENNRAGSRKTLIIRERLVVESCATPRWIAFLMFY